MAYYIDFELYAVYDWVELEDYEIEEIVNEYMERIVGKFIEYGIDHVGYEKIDKDVYLLNVSEKDLNRLKLVDNIDPKEYFHHDESMVARSNGGHHIECTVLINIIWNFIK